MRDVLTWATAAIFGLLGAVHVYWACGGRIGKAAAIPSTNGVAAFAPSKTGTLMVAGALFAAGVVVAAAGQIIPSPVPPLITTGGALMLAAILTARAIGDFRLVGFFKKPSDSRFAALDTRVYAPLCAALAAAIVAIVWMDGTAAYEGPLRY